VKQSSIPHVSMMIHGNRMYKNTIGFVSGL